MAGLSRPKDGVASARLRPAIHVFLVRAVKVVGARRKPGRTKQVVVVIVPRDVI